MKSLLVNLINVMASLVVITGSSLGVSLLTSPTADAAKPSGAETVSECKHNFLGLKPWYNYIGDELDPGVPRSDSDKDKLEARRNKCNVKCFNVFSSSTPNDCGQTRSDVPLVFLAIADDLLRIAGFVALAYVIVGAFKYVASQGNPESTSKAQQTIVNALIGLALAITAVAIVSFIGNKLGT